MAVARAVHSAINRFVPAMAMLNFGGQQTVSTSVQNFVRMTLRKRGFGCSILPRLQVLRVLRRPTQPNDKSAGMEARTVTLAGPGIRPGIPERDCISRSC